MREANPGRRKFIAAVYNNIDTKWNINEGHEWKLLTCEYLFVLCVFVELMAVELMYAWQHDNWNSSSFEGIQESYTLLF